MSLVDTMRELGMEMTRDNYIQLNWLGDPPAQIDAEIEATFPEEF